MVPLNETTCQRTFPFVTFATVQAGSTALKDRAGMNFDIIGDVHGHAHKLQALLKRLCYVKRNGAMRHQERTAIFVGDFIDRGPHQMGTINVVRAMLDAGSAQAVMGNHESNAFAWYMRDPAQSDEHLRRRRGELGLENRHHHAAFLAEVKDKPNLHADVIDWFLTLPLWLDLPDLRAVHACWHPDFMAQLERQLKPGRLLDDAMMVNASRRDSKEYRQVETAVERHRGEASGRLLLQGKVRHYSQRGAHPLVGSVCATYRDAAFVPDQNKAHLPDAAIPATSRIGYAGEKPVFLGHYWLTGRPAILPKVACVAYSAGKGGPLVAYRWSGEPVLSSENFVSSGEQ